MEPKWSQTWDFQELFCIISNGVEVDDAVDMIYVAMANKLVSPTDNSPHTRATFFDMKIKSIQNVCIPNGKQKVFYE